MTAFTRIRKNLQGSAITLLINRMRAQQKSIPGIMINTMPKSASIYILNTLSSSLKLSQYIEPVAPGYFPNYFMRPYKLNQVLKYHMLRQEHFDASEINLHILEKARCQFVLHVRDPRQATLSWAHHFNRLHQDPMAPNYTKHLLFPGYYDLPFEQQLDWHIETHLNSMSDWLRGWVTHLKGNPTNVLLTTYEQMREDEAAFFDRIIEFYEIPKKHFRHKAAPKNMKNHYRKGLSDEWLHVFSDRQKARCDELLDATILDFFNWDKAVSTITSDTSAIIT